MSLKSEIEQYLLENDFSLEENYISDDAFGKSETLIFIHNKTKYDTVSMFLCPNEDFIMVDLYSIDNENEKYYVARRYIIKTLEQFVFLITHTTRSFLCDEKLIS